MSGAGGQKVYGKDDGDWQGGGTGRTEKRTTSDRKWKSFGYIGGGDKGKGYVDTGEPILHAETAARGTYTQHGETRNLTLRNGRQRPGSPIEAQGPDGGRGLEQQEREAGRAGTEDQQERRVSYATNFPALGGASAAEPQLQ